MPQSTPTRAPLRACWSWPYVSSAKDRGTRRGRLITGNRPGSLQERSHLVGGSAPVGCQKTARRREAKAAALAVAGGVEDLLQLVRSRNFQLIVPAVTRLLVQPPAYEDRR